MPKYILPEGFTVTAHTGCEGTPDNTIESLQKGFDLGADIVEFDLNFTEELEPVMSHNDPVGGEVPLAEAFAFLASHKKLLANVDIKKTEGIEKVQQAAVDAGVLEQIFYTGIWESFVEATKKNSPLVPYYINLDVEPELASDKDYIDTLIKKTKDYGAIGINFNKRAATKELVDAFHASGLLVSVFTVNSDEDMRYILSLAPDNITSEHFARLIEIINE